jgi:phosphoglycerate dehydrogenase-like enzyme
MTGAGPAGDVTDIDSDPDSTSDLDANGNEDGDPTGARPDGGDGDPTVEVPDVTVDDPVEVLVLNRSIHGLPPEEYVIELRDRLPDRRIALAPTRADERDLVSDARVITGTDLRPDLLEAADRLELFACIYAGADHLDFEQFSERDVAVTTAAGVHAPNVAEYVIGGLVAQLRRFRRAWRQADRREWRKYEVGELAGSTVAVVGQGAIGTAVVDRLRAFDAETVAVRHSPEKGGPADAVYGYDQFNAALTHADHLVMACPLTETTRGLVDRRALQELPTHAVVVNVARGPVVDTDALVWAIRRNGIGGAVLDVTDPEPLPADHDLWTFENVQITPHNAGGTPRYYDRLADILAANLRKLDAGETDLENRVV